MHCRYRARRRATRCSVFDIALQWGLRNNFYAPLSLASLYRSWIYARIHYLPWHAFAFSALGYSGYQTSSSLDVDFPILPWPAHRILYHVCLSSVIKIDWVSQSVDCTDRTIWISAVPTSLDGTSLYELRLHFALQIPLDSPGIYCWAWKWIFWTWQPVAQAVRGHPRPLLTFILFQLPP